MDKIIKKIDLIINKYGICYKIKNFDKYKKNIPSNQKKEINLKYLDLYVKKYDKHTCIIDKRKQEKFIQVNQRKIEDNRKLPEVAVEKDVMTIKWFLYYPTSDSKSKENLDKFIRKSKKLIDNGLKKNPKKLIIDLREHHGGNMSAAILSMSEIYGDTTLFAFGQKKVLKKTGEWFNIVNGKYIDGKFLTKKLSFDKPIKVLVGENTASSGELVGATFLGRNNVIIKGTSAGWMSCNQGYKINKDLDLNLTDHLITTVDGKFHKDEKIF